MDDETLAIIGGLLSRGAIGRGINGYLANKQNAQQNQLLEDYKRQQMALQEQKTAEAAAKQQAIQAAAQPPQWAQDAGPLGAYAKAPSDMEAALGMAKAGGDPKTMADLLKLGQKKLERIDTETDQQGNRVRVAYFADGTRQVVGKPDAEKLHFANTGGAVGVGINPFTGKQESPGLPATMDPYQKGQLGVAQGNLAQRQKEFAAQQAQQPAGPKPQIVDGQFVFPPDAANPQGRAAPIPGFTGKADPKAAQSAQVPGIVKEANTLLDKATGSYVGTGRDIAAGAVGMATEGAKATAQLRVLAAKLMFAQPRFEGPQGVLDVKLYEQAAGDIANSTKPVEVRKAALQTILEMHQKYGAPQAITGAAPAPAAPDIDALIKKYGQ